MPEKKGDYSNSYEDSRYEHSNNYSIPPELPLLEQTEMSHFYNNVALKNIRNDILLELQGNFKNGMR